MKCTYIVFSCLFCFTVYSQQNLDTIYGNPKSVREKVEFLNESKTQHDYNTNAFRNIKRFRTKSLENFFKNTRAIFLNYYMQFLENGLPKNETWYNKDGSFEREFKYTYNENNNLIEEREIYYNGEYWLTKFHYNQLSKPITISYYMSDEPNGFVHWYNIFDKNNNVIETRRIDEEGEDYSIVYELNHQGNVLKKIRKHIPNWRDLENKELNFLDSLSILHEYEYDKQGNKVLELNYNEEEGRVYSKKTYKYNRLNNLTEYKVFFRTNDSTIYRITNYKYNKQGLKVFQEELSTEDKYSYKSQETFYNKEGFIDKNIFNENNHNTAITYKYKFDKKGNWTKIIKIVNDEPLYVWSRKIRYY